MLLVWDADGKQIPAYQGRAHPFRIRKILAAADRETRWELWHFPRGLRLDVDREGFCAAWSRLAGIRWSTRIGIRKRRRPRTHRRKL